MARSERSSPSPRPAALCPRCTGRDRLWSSAAELGSGSRSATLSPNTRSSACFARGLWSGWRITPCWSHAMAASVRSRTAVHRSATDLAGPPRRWRRMAEVACWWSTTRSRSPTWSLASSARTTTCYRWWMRARPSRCCAVASTSTSSSATLMMPQLSGMDFYAELAVRDPELASKVMFMTAARSRRLLALSCRRSRTRGSGTHSTSCACGV